MRIKVFILFALIIIFQTNLNAQSVQDKSLWGSIEVGYGLGLKESGKNGYTYSLKNRKNEGNLDVTNFRLKGGYYIAPRFSIGAGMGIYTYNGITKAVPIFADFRYLINTLPNLYTFADIGASFFSFGNVSKGFLSDLGAGYKIRLGKNFSLNPLVGYNLLVCKGWSWTNISGDQVNIYETRIRHSIFAGLTFEF
jgi:hypothetical protein